MSTELTLPISETGQHKADLSVSARGEVAKSLTEATARLSEFEKSYDVLPEISEADRFAWFQLAQEEEALAAAQLSGYRYFCSFASLEAAEEASALYIALQDQLAAQSGHTSPHKKMSGWVFGGFYEQTQRKMLGQLSESYVGDPMLELAEYETGVREPDPNEGTYKHQSQMACIRDWLSFKAEHGRVHV